MRLRRCDTLNCSVAPKTLLARTSAIVWSSSERTIGKPALPLADSWSSVSKRNSMLSDFLYLESRPKDIVSMDVSTTEPNPDPAASRRVIA
jgi:hypothetical protein